MRFPDRPLKKEVVKMKNKMPVDLSLGTIKKIFGETIRSLPVEVQDDKL